MWLRLRSRRNCFRPLLPEIQTSGSADPALVTPNGLVKKTWRVEGEGVRRWRKERGKRQGGGKGEREGGGVDVGVTNCIFVYTKK